MERIFGIHAVRQAMLAGEGECLIIRGDRPNQRQQALQELAVELGIPVRQGEARHDEVADQGVALEVSMPRMRSEAELDELLACEIEEPLYLVLDGVTDPRNFGACLRNAASFNVNGVVVPKDKSAPMNEAAIKTASGAASLVPVYQVTNLSRTLEKMRQRGVWVVGTALSEETQPLNEIKLNGAIALVMGAEGRGIRPGTRKKCDFLAEIPAPMPDLSLNVSVATGICLYEVHRQRSSAG